MALFVICLIFGAICAAIASSKGRSTVGFFFLGCFFPLIGLVVVLVVSNLHEEQRHREHAAADRRRLREQLQQEKMKTEAFRQHAGSRLDAHDRVLGVDTRAATPLGAGAAPVGATLTAGDAYAAPPPLSNGPQWHYEVRGQQKGPVPVGTIRRMLEMGTITGASLVWTQGMPDWLPLSDVPELKT